MSLTTCFKYAIGLSRSSCNCAGAPADYKRSDSGFYLDELGNLGKLLGGYEDCGSGGLWRAMERAREKAILSFSHDLSAIMAQVGKARRTNFSGTIGESAAKENVSTSKLYSGLRLSCAPIASGTIRLRAIGALFTHTGSVTVQIYNNRNEQIGDDIVLDTIANRHTVTTLDEPILLPLLESYSEHTEYFITYATSEGTAKANRIHCGCGSWPGPFDCSRPYYHHWSGSQQGSRAWSNWLMAGGWTGDTLDDFDEVSSTATSTAYGLTLLADIYCDASAILCTGSLDFITNPHAGASAEAIMLKAGAYLVEDSLLSVELTRNLQANREALMKGRAEWLDEYARRVQYIGTNTDLSQSDCLECKAKYGLKTRAVYS